MRHSMASSIPKIDQSYDPFKYDNSLKDALDAHLHVVLSRGSLSDARGQIVHSEFWSGSNRNRIVNSNCLTECIL